MEKYIVLEIQTNANGTVGNLVTAFDNRNVAEQKFHQVLSAAAVSTLPCHAATLLNEEGFVLDSKCYHHEVEESE